MNWEPGWAVGLQRSRSQGWTKSLTMHCGLILGPWEDVSAYEQFPQDLSLLLPSQPVMISKFSKWGAEF